MYGRFSRGLNHLTAGLCAVVTPKFNIEVRHLRYVVTAAEQGSSEKASAKLMSGNSTISR